MTDIRTMQEELEEKTLSPLATLSAQSRGREHPMSPCPIRTNFARDRDRILHCKAFRRLKYKTQVFLSPEGDHYRSRLTHTLEVAQIARTIARALRLNEDLTEAIALGHDLGHPPFAHAGEMALDSVMPEGFVHAAQSVRVVEQLENDGKGLNLTYEVRDGIAFHSTGQPASTLEGRVVHYSDKIAYLNHDIDDAIRAGILTEESLPWDVRYVLGSGRSNRISSLVFSIVENSADDIKMADDVHAAYKSLRKFLFDEVYRHPVAKAEESKAAAMVETLYSHFMSHKDKLPRSYLDMSERNGLSVTVADYISGMSDRYAVATFEELFVPKFWRES